MTDNFLYLEVCIIWNSYITFYKKKIKNPAFLPSAGLPNSFWSPCLFLSQCGISPVNELGQEWSGWHILDLLLLGLSFCPMRRGGMCARKDCSNFSVILKSDLDASSWNWKEWEILVACPSKWAMVTFDWELRREGPRSSWPHPSGMELLSSWGGQETGGGREQVMVQILLTLAVFTLFWYIFIN